MTQPFTNSSDAALAILMGFRDGKLALTRKAGSFVGETIVDESPLSEKQTAWLQTLLAKAGLPPLVTGEVRDGQL